MLPLNGEAISPTSAICSEETRADVCATGFWGRRQGTFFAVRVFHPNAPNYLRTQPTSLFRRHELEKKQEYGDRVCSVEYGSFTPLVILTFGGLGTVFYGHLADLLAKKYGTPFAKTLSLLRWWTITAS